MAELALAGDLSRPSRLTVPDLLAWPQHQADVSLQCATSGAQRRRFVGPLLHGVLADAGPGFDPRTSSQFLELPLALARWLLRELGLPVFCSGSPRSRRR